MNRPNRPNLKLVHSQPHSIEEKYVAALFFAPEDVQELEQKLKQAGNHPKPTVVTSPTFEAELK